MVFPVPLEVFLLGNDVVSPGRQGAGQNLVICGVLPDHPDPRPTADKEGYLPQRPQEFLHFILGISVPPKPRIEGDSPDLGEDGRGEAKLVAPPGQSQNPAVHPARMEESSDENAGIEDGPQPAVRSARTAWMAFQTSRSASHKRTRYDSSALNHTVSLRPRRWPNARPFEVRKTGNTDLLKTGVLVKLKIRHFRKMRGQKANDAKP